MLQTSLRMSFYFAVAKILCTQCRPASPMRRTARAVVRPRSGRLLARGKLKPLELSTAMNQRPNLKAAKQANDGVPRGAPIVVMATGTRGLRSEGRSVDTNMCLNVGPSSLPSAINAFARPTASYLHAIRWTQEMRRSARADMPRCRSDALERTATVPGRARRMSCRWGNIRLEN